MFNFYLQLSLLLTGVIVSFYIVRNDLSIYYFMGLLVFVNAMGWALLKEYKIIRYLKTNYPDFYKKHETLIGNKYWKATLKTQLQSLKDEYVNNYLKN